MGIVMITGTLNLNQIVSAQQGNFLDWFIFRQPLAALIFFIAATAEASRTPFDLTEADSEIVAGFATEYSGMRFGFFFFAEYVNMFILSALTAVLFLGGSNAPIDIDPLLDALGITTPVNIALDPGSMGTGLLWVIAHRSGAHHRHPHGRHLDAQVVVEHPRLAHRRRSCCSTCWCVGALLAFLAIDLDWVIGPVLVPGQDHRPHPVLRAHARHAAARAHRPADGLRLEVAGARGARSTSS